MQSRRWYQSPVAIILASIIFPPAGLILLGARQNTSVRTKALGSVAIVLLGFVYVIGLSRLGVLPGLLVSRPDMEPHYSELERHREQQRAEAAPTDSDSGTADAAVETASPQPATPDAASDSSPARNYWTEYRGPGRLGRYDEVPILVRWPDAGLRALWRQPIGGGFSSFAIAEGRAFTIEQRRNQEVVAAYDVESGRELWAHRWNAEFIERQGGDGPRATPTWNDGRIYALGATGLLTCLDAATGNPVWSVNILRDNNASNLDWGMAASPLVVDGKVIVQPGGTSARSVVAYDKLTGKAVWRSLSDRQAYVSPMLVTLAGERHLMVVTSRRAVGLSIDSGTQLWEYPWDTSMGINCSQPIVVSDNRFFISSGYGKGAALVELARTGSGFATRTIWQNNLMKNKFNSSVLHNGHIYGLDEGILACLDVQTGERKWKGGRYGYGQLVLAGNNLIVLTDGGELVLVEATPEQHRELTRFSALEGKTWNYPALTGGRLLVRNETQMACFDVTIRGL